MDQSEDIRLFSLRENGVSTIIRCLLVAELDETPTKLLNATALNNGDGTGFVDLIFPWFNRSLQYDPDFSVVIDTTDSGDGVDSALIIGLSVGLGVGIPLIALFIGAIILAV